MSRLIPTPVVQSPKSGITIRRVSNGGWVVGSIGEPGYLSETIASFTDSSDLLSWLHEELRDLLPHEISNNEKKS